MIDWTHAGSALVAAFLGSLVECVEALTIVLAVGTVRGWKPALAGVGAGGAFLILLVAAFGSLLTRIPLQWLQTAVGLLLVLFGMRWLRKAVLRSAGLIPLREEGTLYAKELAALGADRPSTAQWDAVALVTSFKAVVLEGLEVVFIVIATSVAARSYAPAALGALAALAVVVVLGISVKQPLTRVPENMLKFGVGVLLSAFGVFWLGEGLGWPWPGEDLAIPGIIAGLLVASLGAVQLCRAKNHKAAQAASLMGSQP